jgi:hypothetical protein
MIGVVPHYKKFRASLAKRKSEVAKLQLLGRLEDYLAKEFASSVLRQSKSQTLPLLNIGQAADGRRIDVLLIAGDISDSFDKKLLRVWGFVEMKYLRNKHRLSDGNRGAEDEHGEVFKSLHKQLARLKVERFAGYPVRLRGGKGDTYGMIFASYVHRVAEKHEPDRFLGKIVAIASRHGFQTHNFKTPRLYSVYENVPVTVLGGRFAVSLYSGLWRVAGKAVCEC